MTTSLDCLTRNCTAFSSLTLEEHPKPKTLVKPDLLTQIFSQLLSQQKTPRNYVLSARTDSLRTNFINWLFRIPAKTDVSMQTLFNTMSMVDALFSEIGPQEDSSIFQLLAVTCFYLSYKTFEKKTMTISFVEKYLLGGKWPEDDIRKAEIYVLEKLDYNLHTVNTYSFYEMYRMVINKHFSNDIVRQVDFLVYYLLKQATLIKDFFFWLSASEQIRIVLNASFLLLSRLTVLDLSQYENFFFELSSLSDQEVPEFEKFSNMLFSGLRINEDFLERFSRIQ